MSRATMKSKYQTLKGFHTKSKAEKWIGDDLSQEGVRIKERTWTHRDKKRYYVQVLTRKGVKKKGVKK
jgi:hypothetical protein